MQDFIRIGGPVTSAPLNENFRRLLNAINIANTNLVFSEDDGIVNTIEELQALIERGNLIDGQVCYVVSSGELYRWSAGDQKWHKIMDIGQTFRQGFLNSGLVLMHGRMTADIDTITIPDMLVYFKNQPGDDRYLKGMYLIPETTITVSSLEGGAYSILVDCEGNFSLVRGLPSTDDPNNVFIGSYIVNQNRIYRVYTLPDIAYTSDRGYFLLNGGQASGLNVAPATGHNISRADGYYYDEGINYTEGEISSFPEITDNKSNYNLKFFENKLVVEQLHYIYPNNSFENPIIEASDGLLYNQYVNGNTLSQVPAGHFTIQRHLVAPDGEDFLIFGDTIYNSMADALANINSAFGLDDDFPYAEASRLIIGTDAQGNFDVTDSNLFRVETLDRLHQIGTFTPEFADNKFKVYSSKDDTTPAAIRFNLKNLDDTSYYSVGGMHLAPLPLSNTRQLFSLSQKYVAKEEDPIDVERTRVENRTVFNNYDGYELADYKDIKDLRNRVAQIESEIWNVEKEDHSTGHGSGGLTLNKNNSSRKIELQATVDNNVLSYQVVSTALTQAWMTVFLKIEYQLQNESTWHTLYEKYSDTAGINLFPAGRNTTYNNTAILPSIGNITIRISAGQGLPRADQTSTISISVTTITVPIYGQSIRYRLSENEYNINNALLGLDDKADKSITINGHDLSQSFDLTTDEIGEGSNHLYYTDTRVNNNGHVRIAYTHATKPGTGIVTDQNPHGMSTDDLTVNSESNRQFVTIDELGRIQNLPADTASALNDKIGPIPITQVEGDHLHIGTATHLGDVTALNVYTNGARIDVANGVATLECVGQLNESNVLTKSQFAKKAAERPDLYGGRVDRAIVADGVSILNTATKNQYYGTNAAGTPGVFDLPVYVSTADAEEYLSVSEKQFVPIKHSVMLEHLANGNVSYPATSEETKTGTNVYDLVKNHYHKVYNSGTQGPYIDGTQTQDTSAIYYSYIVPSNTLRSGNYFFTYENINYRFTTNALAAGKEIKYTPATDTLKVDNTILSKVQVEPEDVNEDRLLSFTAKTDWNKINEWNFGDNLTVTVTNGRATINAAVAGSGVSNFINLGDVNVTYTDQDLGKIIMLDKINGAYKLVWSAANLAGMMNEIDFVGESATEKVRWAELADTATTANTLQGSYIVNDGATSATGLWSSSKIVTELNKGVKTYSGTTTPSSSLGKDGDLYILLDE